MSQDLQPQRALSAPKPKPPIVYCKIEWTDPAGNHHLNEFEVVEGMLPVWLEVWVEGSKVYGLSKNEYPPWDPRS